MMKTFKIQFEYKLVISIVAIVTLTVMLLFTVRYIWFTGNLPSFDREKRFTDYARGYFNKKSKIFFREVDVASTGFKCYIAFEKSSYFEKLLVYPKSLEEVSQHLDKTSAAKKLNEGTKLVIFKSAEFDIIKPFMQIVWPLINDYEIEVVNNGGTDYRIYDVSELDMDNDGKNEIIVHWLDYGGGSGGTFMSTILCASDGTYKIVDSFPSTDLSKDNLIYLEKEGTQEFTIDGKSTKVSVFNYSTDSYYTFVQGVNGEQILLSAQPFNDGRCHYCAQSWLLKTYKFVGKKFVPDIEFPHMVISKKVGWSINDVHGYNYSSLMGLISPVLKPSWMDMEERDAAFIKSRNVSVAKKRAEQLYLKANR